MRFLFNDADDTVPAELFDRLFNSTLVSCPEWLRSMTLPAQEMPPLTP